MPDTLAPGASLYGKVVNVETRNLGEPTQAAAAIGATVLYVADAATFDESGGQVLVDGTLLTYTSTDVDLNTITLAAPLAVAVADQATVEVYPATPVSTALVDLGEEGGDSVPATVPHYLVGALTDGTRDAADAETVTIEQRGTYEYVVADVSGIPLNTIEPERVLVGLSDSDITLRQYLDIRFNWGQVSSFQQTLSAVTAVNSATNVALTDLGWTLDLMVDGLIPTTDDMLRVEVSLDLDVAVSTATAGNLMVVECSKKVTGSSDFVETRQMLVSGATVGRNDWHYSWMLDLWGPTHPFGLGAADWQITFRARRIVGSGAAWNINPTHSTATLRVVGSERLGA